MHRIYLQLIYGCTNFMLISLIFECPLLGGCPMSGIIQRFMDAAIVPGVADWHGVHYFFFWWIKTLSLPPDVCTTIVSFAWFLHNNQPGGRIRVFGLRFSSSHSWLIRDYFCRKLNISLFAIPIEIDGATKAAMLWIHRLANGLNWRSFGEINVWQGNGILF